MLKVKLKEKLKRKNLKGELNFRSNLEHLETMSTIQFG